jgi:hypothetical protein
MGLEAATEQGLKTAFEAFTDTLALAERPVYRCFFLDDEPNEDEEERKYPLVDITAQPNAPTQGDAGWTFRDCPVALKFATHRTKDAKRADLRTLYEGCRAIIDAKSTIAVEGYNVVGILVDEGGEAGTDDQEHYITLPVTVKICGA